MTDTSYDWEARQLDRGDLAAIPAQKSTTPTEPISTFLTPQGQEAQVITCAACPWTKTLFGTRDQAWDFLMDHEDKRPGRGGDSDYDPLCDGDDAAERRDILAEMKEW